MWWLSYSVLGASVWIGNGLVAEVKRLCPRAAGQVSVALTALLAAPNLGPVFGPHALLSFGAASLSTLLRHAAAFIFFWTGLLLLNELASSRLKGLWLWWKAMRVRRVSRQRGSHKPPQPAA